MIFFDGNDTALCEPLPSLPKILALFFFCRDSHPAPVTEYFMNHLSCGSVSALTESLADEDERDILRKLVTEALFGGEIVRILTETVP